MDHIRDIENILRDININHKNSIKESLEKEGYVASSRFISVGFLPE